MNEWITRGQQGGELTVLCECGHETCATSIRLRRQEYEGVRKNSLRFFVSPDHLFPDIEHPLMARSNYWVVEKFEGVGDFAEESDPRQGS